MTDSKSSPPPDESDSQKIFDAYAGAFKNQPDVTEANRQFIENLEHSFPGVDLSTAKLMLPPVREKEAAE